MRPTDNVRAQTNRDNRVRFARSHIRSAQQHGPVPRYGSDAWHRLDYADPRRWAAVIMAAECWAQDGDDIAGRIRRDLAWEVEAHQRLDAAEFAAMAARVRASARQPSHAELVRRRAEHRP